MTDDHNAKIPLQAGPTAAKNEKAPEGGAGNEVAFNRLDTRVVRLWRIENFVVSGLILAAATVGGGLLWILTDAPPFVAPALFAAALSFMGLLAGWLPPRRFAAQTYRVDDISLELRSGIVWRKSVLIPISRVQHLDLHRGPLERRFGLATLQVHTAGTSHATHSIPGLDAGLAVDLREKLAESANLVIQ
jgi:membrane protein YdbS with pleckstrin-like domain